MTVSVLSNTVVTYEVRSVCLGPSDFQMQQSVCAYHDYMEVFCVLRRDSSTIIGRVLDLLNVLVMTCTV